MSSLNRESKKQNKIVVYTSIFGEYDGLIPQSKIPGVDFICFTDQDFKSNSWKIIKCSRKYNNNTRSARHYKILPHKYLVEYDYSIWIDGNFIIKTDLRDLISLLEKHPMIGFKQGKDCIYQEFEGIMQIGREKGKYKDDPETMRLQMERYKQEGFPANYGLTQTNVLIRRHHHPDVIRIMESWWAEIEKGSLRDQLSLFYALWKTDLSIHVLPYDSRNSKWFYMIGTHRKNYTWKLFRYRIKKIFGLQRKYDIRY